MSGERAFPPVENDRSPTSARPNGVDASIAIEPSRLGDAAESREIGGPKGPEPTRYGDWERAGRCIDF